MQITLLPVILFRNYHWSGIVDRKWHQKFIEYTEFIASHQNYEGLHITRKDDNLLKWVASGKSAEGQERKKWWDKQCKNHGISFDMDGRYAKIARMIHPTKLHVCQICGRELSIEYIYPKKGTIKFFSESFGIKIEPYGKDIFELLDLAEGRDPNSFQAISEFFKYEESLPFNFLKQQIKQDHVDKASKSFLSPGVMSNSPDRFDGFHSDGACCRSKSDKGRSRQNLSRYTQDRRAYENWSDGDWKMADRLMAEFNKNGVSADHIGPISLGFCHRPKFAPLTKEENSAKGNRMSFTDVKTLINDEKLGQQVISWHSREIWDLLKNKINSDSEAETLSSLMRKNLHQVLTLFSQVKECGGESLLKTFLNPDYSFYDYEFIGFNPQTGDYESSKKTKKNGQNQKNNAKRYIRIAFEALDEYAQKDNRIHQSWNSEEIDTNLEKIRELLIENNMEQSKELLIKTVNLLGNINAEEF